jgi:hypothetical protein
MHPALREQKSGIETRIILLYNRVQEKILGVYIDNRYFLAGSAYHDAVIA